MNSIEVHNLFKKFRIYHDKSLTFKEKVLFWGRTRYSEIQVLNDVSFNVEKGKTIGLIGQNGSGKSTLLKLLTGIIYPDKGSINVNGKVSSLLELGAGFHPDFSGRENIYNNASIFGLSKKEIDRRFNQIVEFSELEEFIDNPVRTYSSGMYMRLAFSVAINVDPDILLIDEILAVGDAAFQKKCFNKFLEFKDVNKSIIIVSHDNTSIKKLCDYVAWLDNGVIRQFGDTDYVIDEYLQFMHNKNKTIQQTDAATVVADNTNEDREVHRNIAVPEEVPRRWGNKSIEITKIRFLNNDFEETTDLKYGSSLTIEIYYKVNESVENPVFGIGIFLMDGTRCYGNNTSIDEIRFGTFQKGLESKISFFVERLDLINGTYIFNFAAHALDGFAYDYLNKMFQINVYSNKYDIGIFKPKHKWIIN